MIDLSPVFVPKAADVLAETLREQILNGRLGVGSLRVCVLGLKPEEGGG